MTPRLTAGLTVLSAAWALSALASECPQAVKDAAMKAHPNLRITACKQEIEDGKTQYEVKLVGKAGEKLELELSTEGQILETEESVALGAVPPAVLAALKAKYPDAKPEKAEKQTSADGQVTYEIAFASGRQKKSATFQANGTFIEEE